jgi:UDP-N-acetylglucosamine 2-epimerase (non-hydrolysing)
VIAVVYGTTGELIKLAPVLRRLHDHPAAMLTLTTGQQVEQIPRLLDDLDLPQPDIWLGRGSRGHDLERRRNLPAWLFEVLNNFIRVRGSLRQGYRADPSKPLLLIHGDTMTTVLGALMGRSVGVPVAHIEAGMRSGDWRNPFPEELNRLAAARLARIHFAPGAHATANLRAIRVRGEILDTRGNTIRDALDLVPPVAPAVELPSEPFGLASLHRAELLSSRAALSEILESLRDASRCRPILFIDHPVTVAAVVKHKLESLFDDRFRRIPRQSYFTFVSLLKASEFLVTDSGGSQQECAALGHPCLVHRAVTEHPEGLNESVVLSRMDIFVVRAFLADPGAYRRQALVEKASPTDVIVEYLLEKGYLASRSAGVATTSVLGA